MKLAPGTPLSVSLAFDADTRLPVARLAMDAGVAQLEWSREVIDRQLPVNLRRPQAYPPHQQK